MWHNIYHKENKLSTEDVASYLGKAKELWISLDDFMDSINAKKSLSFSCCSMNPGWNIKYKKSEKSLGTFYPEKDSFSVLLVFGTILEDNINIILPQLLDEFKNIYVNAKDYMKYGKSIMSTISNKTQLNDLKKLILIKSNS